MEKENYHHGDLKNALIQAGTEILSEEGIGSLSLRKVASRAGVSHSAPYAHFKDKQALIAAISTEGFRLLYERMGLAADRYRKTPDCMLFEVGYAYLNFALENPAYFKVMFSGTLEKEKDYPDFVEMSKKNFNFLVDQVKQCQSVGLLKSGAPDVLAVNVWCLVHGFVALLLERQIPSSLLDQFTLKVLLCKLLNQITLVDISLNTSSTD